MLLGLRCHQEIQKDRPSLPITAGKEFPERRTVSHLVQRVSLYFLIRRMLLMIQQQNLFLLCTISVAQPRQSL